MAKKSVEPTKKMRSGGTKRKIPMEKIMDKATKAVTYSKRTGGLYSKASQLCLLDGSQIAIIATPPSFDSNLSFYSFAHPSVHAIVSVYLSGQSLGPVPWETTKLMRENVAICLAQKDLGLGFWWEKESPDNPQHLLQSLSSMRKLMTNLEEELATDQTLILNCLTNKDTEFIDSQQQNQVCDSFCVSENSPTTNLDVWNPNSEMSHSSLSHHVFSGKAHQQIAVSDYAASNTNNIEEQDHQAICVTDNAALPNSESDGWSNDQELDVETIYSLFYDHLVSDNSHQDLLVDHEISLMETTNPLLFSDFGDFVEGGAPLLCGLDDFDDHCFSEAFTNIAPL